MIVYNRTKKEILLDKVQVANTFFTRFKGLMFKKELEEGEGLLITPCNSIHMFFMRFPLDVIFLNENNEVVGIVSSIKPWRVSKVFFKAKYCIEISAGFIQPHNLEIGDALYFDKP